MADPVFVVGNARSGTSAVSAAIRKTRYSGFNEGHLSGLLPKLFKQVDEHWSRFDENTPRVVLMSNLPKSEFTDGIQDLYKEIFLKHNNNSEFIIDKTPDYYGIAAIPFLLDIWPDAKFIYCQRRPLEVILSSRKKWPGIPLKNSCRIWKHSVVTWHEIVEKLDRNYLEIEQIEIVLDPDGISQKLTDLLELSPEETALLADDLGQRQHQVTSSSYNPVTADDMGFDAEEWATFNEVCGDIFERRGYSYDAGYFIDAGRREQVLKGFDLPPDTKLIASAPLSADAD